METASLKCSHCGAVLNIDIKPVICDYCISETVDVIVMVIEDSFRLPGRGSVANGTVQ